MSPGLYYQMVGRGFRLCHGKDNCLVLDYGGNIERHGPLDQIQPKHGSAGKGNGTAPTKVCPKCQTVVLAMLSICPDCQHEFPQKPKAISDKPSDTPIISEVVMEKYDVRDVRYSVHYKRNDPTAPQSMKVDYIIGNVLEFSEWVCVEHEGFAQRKALNWWKKRCNENMPCDASEAVSMAKSGFLAHTHSVTIKKDGKKFPDIVDWEVGEIPDVSSVVSYNEEDIPF